LKMSWLLYRGMSGSWSYRVIRSVVFRGPFRSSVKEGSLNRLALGLILVCAP
jgi:hypothetical protein